MGEESTKNTTPVITDAAHLKSVYPEFIPIIVPVIVALLRISALYIAFAAKTSPPPD